MWIVGAWFVLGSTVQTQSQQREIKESLLVPLGREIIATSISNISCTTLIRLILSQCH